MRIIVLMLHLIYLNFQLNAQCQWGALDLTPIDGATIQCSAGGYDYQYLPCDSNSQCGGYMVAQKYISGGCVECGGVMVALAVASASITPQQTTISGQNAYTFKYSNGAFCDLIDQPRKLDLTFICDPTIDTFQSSGLNCGEPSVCVYYLTIHTKLACLPPTFAPSMASISPSFAPTAPPFAPSIAPSEESDDVYNVRGSSSSESGDDALFNGRDKVIENENKRENEIDMNVDLSGDTWINVWSIFGIIVIVTNVVIWIYCRHNNGTPMLPL